MKTAKRGILVFIFAAFLSLLTSSLSLASPNDFTISSFAGDYYLTRDTDKRTRLVITETIVASFPEFDQNHGIERALPTRYDGHTLHLNVDSVKDAAGHKWKYESRFENDNEVLRIGDADRYVHGMQTYVISYTYRDVAALYDDHDELRWNTNGLQWQQPFESLTARLHIAPDIAKNLQNTSCVYGYEGQANECLVGQQQKSQDGSVTVEFQAPITLLAGQNLTFGARFPSDTFVGYKDPSLVSFLKDNRIGVMSVLGAILVAIIFVWRRGYVRYGRAIAGRGTIIPEYLPPKGVSVLTSAVILEKLKPSITAQVIDLAVRHYLKIYEKEEQKLFGSSKKYSLELIKDTSTLLSEEVGLLKDFLGNPTVGAKVNLDEVKSSLSVSLYNRLNSAKKQTYASRYYAHIKVPATYYLSMCLVILFGAGLFVAAVLLSEYSVLEAVIAGGAAIVFGSIAIVAMISFASFHQLSREGSELKEYLLGLRDYMKVAEEDRLKMLQSPEGATKLGVTLASGDTATLVKLYERVLPYAVLFGIEQEWSKQMQLYYTEGTSPNWYTGSGAFHAAAFASSFSSMSSSMNSYSSSASSSSSGGSGSGSGGGGGGGGGW